MRYRILGALFFYLVFITIALLGVRIGKKVTIQTNQVREIINVQQGYLYQYSFEATNDEEYQLLDLIKHSSFPSDATVIYLPENACRACILSLFVCLEEEVNNPRSIYVLTSSYEKDIEIRSQMLQFIIPFYQDHLMK